MLLSLFNLLKELLGIRAKRRQMLYDKFIEQAFRDVVVVHTDYMKMFDEALDLVPKDGETTPQLLQPAIKRLHTRRIEYEATRAKLRSYFAECMKFNVESDFHRFAELATTYLTSPNGRETRAFTAIDEMRTLGSASSEAVSASDAREILLEAMADLRAHMALLSQIYAKITLNHVRSA